jgi:uncharacterized glyoxalase superfamily protein PhnB
MTTIELKAIPTFRILNYELAMSFYKDFLGFNIDWESRESNVPIYMQVSKNGLQLHLSENERFTTGGVVFVESKGLNDYHSELSNRKGAHALADVTTTPWGTMQLEIEDPFGNLLRFNEVK